MKTIERLRQEKMPLPKQLASKYSEELTEMNYGFNINIADFKQNQGKPTGVAD
jgi:hypothetical protein